MTLIDQIQYVAEKRAEAWNARDRRKADELTQELESLYSRKRRESAALSELERLRQG